MELTHFPRDTEPAVVAGFLREHGYAIVDEVADLDLMDRLAAEVDPYVESSDAGRDEYDGRFTRRTGALIARCPSVRELVMHPLAIGVAGDRLSHASTMQLHLTQLITIGPGETQQQLHRDQMAFDYFDFPVDYHVQCNTMWALTDFTEANGATHIVPGSSTVTDDAAATMPSGRADMRRGSVLFYDGKVIHGGGANTTSTVRQGVNLTYSVGWVRQEENQYLACPPDIARALDDDLLRLMGYQQGAFALGYVGDQQDALSVLRGTHAKVKLVSDFAHNNSNYRAFVNALDTPGASRPPEQ